MFKKQILFSAFFVFMFAIPSMESAQSATVSSKLEQLDDIAREYRSMFKSSNRGGCFLELLFGAGDGSHAADDEQSKKIEEIKKNGAANRASYEDPDGKFVDGKGKGAKRYKDPEALHLSVLDLAKMAQSTMVNGSLVGNCGEISASIYSYLYKRYKGLEIAQMRVPGGDHQFVMVKCGGNSFIVDGWAYGGQAILVGSEAAEDSIYGSQGWQSTSHTVGGNTFHTTQGTLTF